MPDQDTKPTAIEESSEIGKPQKFATTLRRLLWVVPAAILIVIVGLVLLALLGPAIGNVYSYTGNAL